MTQPLQDLFFRMADDKSKVRLEVCEIADGVVIRTLYAFEMAPAVVDNMITQLAQIREAMNDPFPTALDPGKVAFPRVQLDPSFQVMVEGPLAKRFLIALRHPGFGWMPFAFTKEPGQKLADALVIQVLRIARLPPGLITTSGMTKL